MLKLRDVVVQPLGVFLDSISFAAQVTFILGTLTGILVFLTMLSIPYVAGYAFWSLLPRRIQACLSPSG